MHSHSIPHFEHRAMTLMAARVLQFWFEANGWTAFTTQIAAPYPTLTYIPFNFLTFAFMQTPFIGCSCLLFSFTYKLSIQFFIFSLPLYGWCFNFVIIFSIVWRELSNNGYAFAYSFIHMQHHWWERRMNSICCVTEMNEH